jgi:hypothetical protein
MLRETKDKKKIKKKKQVKYWREKEKQLKKKDHLLKYLNTKKKGILPILLKVVKVP